MAGGNQRGPNPSLPRQNIIPEDSKPGTADWTKKAAREIYEDIVRGASAWASQSVVKIEEVIARNVPQPQLEQAIRGKAIAEWEAWKSARVVPQGSAPECSGCGRKASEHYCYTVSAYEYDKFEPLAARDVPQSKPEEK